MEPFNLSKLEESMLAFWKEHDIFEKSIKNRAKRKPFVFFEGPPTANGRPGIHHFLARACKDVICRYQTMQGKLVTRKAGWDTHGLPVELGVEKMLGLKNKKEIEAYGVAEFNAKAKESVWQYKDEWERFTERMGFWLDMKDPYVTYDNRYIQNLWFVLAAINKNYPLEKDFRVSPYCTRCGTVLSSHELGQPGAYRLTRDPSLYLKFELAGTKLGKKKEYVLVWTTTPWTLPANVAIAVHPDLSYTCYESDKELLWAVKLPEKLEQKVTGGEIKIIKSVKGSSLVGKKYVPLYAHKEVKNAYKIVSADFVSAEDGTGLVHIAPAFGEEDMKVAKKQGLPVLLTLDDSGVMKRGEPGEGLFAKDADRVVFEQLRDRGLVVDDTLGVIEHEYPFCWRCDTPLLYMARESWFVRMSKLKKEMVKNNTHVNWIPQHVQDGRFGGWLRELKDWAIARERYWGTPLPIWECEKCHHTKIVGSLDELNNQAYFNNEWYVMRHGESSHNVDGLMAGGAFFDASHLTEKGSNQIHALGKKLQKEKIDVIYCSPAERTKETAEIVRKYVKAPIFFDERLVEIKAGIFDGKSIDDYGAFRASLSSPTEKFLKQFPGGESLEEVARRMMSAVFEINKKHVGKRILLVSHGDPIWMLQNTLEGHTPEEIFVSDYPHIGEYKNIEVYNYPYNKEFRVDLHKPFIDHIYLKCQKCKGKMVRVREVMDVWFDSGAMPFAQSGLLSDCPESKKNILSCIEQYPADYIAEGVDQTRGWFYTLLAISTLLKLKPSYKNVLVHGLVLDEQGKKMSKSRGNVVNPWDVMNKYGADAARWYFYTLNHPYESKKFSLLDLEKSMRKFFITFWNVHQFYETYASKISNFQFPISKTSTNFLDRWLATRLDQVIKKTTKALDAFEMVDAARELEQFVVEDFSRWWLRRSRRRFQRPESKKELEIASSVFYETLKTIITLVAPFAPFFAEGLYQELRKKDDSLKESVHLEDWVTEGRKPFNTAQGKQKVENRKEILEQMELVRRVCALGLRSRAEKGLKVRQPLASLEIKYDLLVDKEMLNMVMEEVNVKKARRVKVLSHDAIINETDLAIALDTVITDELREEGVVRDLMRSLQELRAEAGLNVGEQAELFVVGEGAIKHILEQYGDLIKKEVSIKNIVDADTAICDAEKEIDIDGKVMLKLKKL
ncbi:MAG: class I tRNA ligase family protein [Parcubacteria group bacterium]|nr:class I tRNA ligase family protein [Parcubacteria group bacterium]